MCCWLSKHPFIFILVLVSKLSPEAPKITSFYILQHSIKRALIVCVSFKTAWRKAQFCKLATNENKNKCQQNDKLRKSFSAICLVILAGAGPQSTQGLQDPAFLTATPADAVNVGSENYCQSCSNFTEISLVVNIPKHTATSTDSAALTPFLL